MRIRTKTVWEEDKIEIGEDGSIETDPSFVMMIHVLGDGISVLGLESHGRRR